MLSKTRTTPADSPAPRAMPDPVTGPVGNGSAVDADPDLGAAGAFAALAIDREKRRDRFRRHRDRCCTAPCCHLR